MCAPLVTVNSAVRLYGSAGGIGCAYIVTAAGADEQPAVILEKAGGFGQSEIRTYYSNVPNYGIAFRVGETTGMYIQSQGNVTATGAIDANNGFGTVVAYVNQGTTVINCDLASSLSDGTYLINAVMVRGGGGINQTYSATWLYHHYSSTAGSDVISTLVASNSPNNNNGLISLTGTTVCIGWGGSRGPASLTAMRIRFAP